MENHNCKDILKMFKSLQTIYIHDNTTTSSSSFTGPTTFHFRTSNPDCPEDPRFVGELIIENATIKDGKLILTIIPRSVAQR